jgi:hypothetical protein
MRSLVTFSLAISALLLPPLAGGVGAQQWQQPINGNRVISSRPAWADKLFKEKIHDFGTVARATKQSCEFTFVNPTKSNIVMQSVSPSCRCAEPSIKTRVVKPGETGRINVNFNTIGFIGDRKATIRLIVTSPQWVEIQLGIKGTIRGDIVVQPGNVDFQTVDAGKQSERKIDIKYAGYDTWKIRDIRPTNPNIKVTLEETQRGGGLVSYKATVKLSGEHRPGYISEQIVFVTNDNRLAEFPVSVAGYLKPSIEVPSFLSVGEIEKGKTINRRIIVKSVTDFKILAVTCNDKRVQVTHGDKSKKLHFLDLTVTASDGGSIMDDLVIKTDVSQAKIKLTGSISSPLSESDIVDKKD